MGRERELWKDISLGWNWLPAATLVLVTIRTSRPASSSPSCATILHNGWKKGSALELMTVSLSGVTTFFCSRFPPTTAHINCEKIYHLVETGYLQLLWCWSPFVPQGQQALHQAVQQSYTMDGKRGVRSNWYIYIYNMFYLSFDLQ